MESFIDSISEYDSQCTLQFSAQTTTELLAIISRFGSQEIPMSSNLKQLLLQLDYARVCYVALCCNLYYQSRNPSFPSSLLDLPVNWWPLQLHKVASTVSSWEISVAPPTFPTYLSVTRVQLGSFPSLRCDTPGWQVSSTSYHTGAVRSSTPQNHKGGKHALLILLQLLQFIHYHF